MHDEEKEAYKKTLQRIYNEPMHCGQERELARTVLERYANEPSLMVPDLDIDNHIPDEYNDIH